jgi:hypothetical protein
MAIRVLHLMARFASRFVHELLPVALASVIGALVVNHYGRQPASPSIVVQAQPSASETAIAQSLREDHELIASFVKRNQDREIDDRHSESLGTQVASVAPIAFSLADPPLPEPRPAALQKAVARLAPKAATRKKPTLTEAPAPQPDPPAIVSENPPVLVSSLPPAQLEFEPRARPMIRFAGAVREWAADVAQAPGRVAFVPRWPDWPSAPALIRPLAFFRQN